MKKLIVLLLIFLLAACTTIPATRIPTPPASMHDLQATGTAQAYASWTEMVQTITAQPPQNTPAPTATEMLPTNMPAPTPALQPAQPIALTSFHMIDAAVGWGIEGSGHILHTQDGGLTWQDITPGNGSYSTYDFFALDADHAWAVDKLQGVIWSTVDGGKSWEQTENPVATGLSVTVKLYFIDAQAGWYFGQEDGHGIAHPGLSGTIDGGKTWKINDSFEAYSFYTDMLVVDENTVYLSGGIWGDVRDNGSTPATGYIDGKAVPDLEKTTDGGKTWNVISLPRLSPIPAELNALPLADSVMACRVASLKFAHAYSRRVTASVNCQVGTENGAQWFYDAFHYFTDDGEKWYTWQPTIEDNATNDFINPLVGWRQVDAADGKSCHLQKTINNGQSWNTIKTTSWCATQLDFVNDNLGWALAASDDATALLYTKDGGKTWEEINPAIENH